MGTPLGRQQTPHERMLEKLGMVSAPALAELDTPTGEDATDTRPGASDSDKDDTLIRALIHLPASLKTLEHAVARVLQAIVDIAAPAAWANSADVSNAAASAGTFGGGTALIVFGNYTNANAVRLRNAFIGTSAAALVQLAIIQAKNASDLISPQANSPRVVGTVRTTTNNLSAWFPGEILLKQGEALILNAPGGGALSYDFSCDYRLLPQG